MNRHCYCSRRDEETEAFEGDAIRAQLDHGTMQSLSQWPVLSHRPSLSPKMDFLKPEKTYSQLKQANTVFRLWRNPLNQLISVHDQSLQETGTWSRELKGGGKNPGQKSWVGQLVCRSMAKFSLSALLTEWKPHTTYYFTSGIMKAFASSACFFRDNKSY